MMLKDFPKLSGPPPIIWGLGMLVASGLLLYFYPFQELFLAITIADVAMILVVVVRAGPWLTRHDRNFLLTTTLVILLALYGVFRGFDKLDFVYAYVFLAMPAMVYYYARRIYAIRYAWALAIDYSETLSLEGSMDFAEQCRRKYRKDFAALMVSAEVYKTIAEDGLRRGAEVKAIHIVAMQKYAHMLLYGEAKGLMGEGEWFAKKAHELSKKLLAQPSEEATLH